ncbi:SHOCT domain-containing protein [Weissella confusa]|uniref:SHOCT domain-containing protein n=1 Tax=Weissella fermenti TaxID=2987699 RepID=A0ABT6D2H6_9LACO|nr:MULTISPECIES: SHOCT domain-containing protein [Weissella]MBJ7688507.1 SHOCT domain-containing protein [Weissella confusa]MCW0927266.1 SHOCT domain-containing protein [Weissella sp. LMG 11983]MDF9299707.1 SHOCT domain-containing protein [Weissella sp. BK2]
MLEEIKALKDLLDAGAITQEEFDKLKQDAINGEMSDIDNYKQAAGKSTDNQVSVVAGEQKPQNPQKPIAAPTSKRPIGIIVTLAVLIVGFIIGGMVTRETKADLSLKVGNAVRNNAPDELLKQFDETSQNAVWALPGTQQLINDWSVVQNPDSIVDTLARGEDVIDYDDDQVPVRIEVRHKKVWLFFDKYYLSTTPVKVNFASSYDHDTFRLNADSVDTTSTDVKSAMDEKVSTSDIKSNGIFPGFWMFDTYDKDGTQVGDDSWIRGTGRLNNDPVTFD